MKKSKNEPLITILKWEYDELISIKEKFVLDFNEKKLAIYFWDGSAWRNAGSPVVDTTLKKVSVSVNHFTLYDIAVDTGASVTINSFNAYWSKNPVRQVDHSIFTAEIPKDGKVSLSIYDMAGDLVRIFQPQTSTAGSKPNWDWDGGDSKGKFAGAGLYIYLVKYESTDGTIKKIIRKPVGLLKD